MYGDTRAPPHAGPVREPLLIGWEKSLGGAEKGVRKRKERKMWRSRRAA